MVESAFLSVRDVHKRFDERAALGGVSFDVAPGECLGLLGPNGAGKSTLMAVISGLLAADAGSVSIGGQADPTRRDVRARVGLASQAVALYPNLSARENLDFFARIHGLSRARRRERVERALELAELHERGHDRVRQLSGGMQRRLHMACALVHEPALLLLDEPTSGVDPQSREHMFTALGRLRASGLTMVYSTHLMEEVERLCDRVAIVDHGKLVALDTPAALISRLGRGPREPIAERPSLEQVFLRLTGHALRDA